MSLVRAQQHPVLRRYPLRRHRLSTAGGTLSIVCPSSSPGGALVGAMERAARRGTEPPYWAQVWPAAVGLGRFLLRQFGSQGLRGTEVVDLGCGVGVAGAAAALAGAHVTMVDRDADALEFARFNGDRSAEQSGAPPTATVQMDWNERLMPDGADHVLLADVTYHRDHHAAVRRQLEAALAVGAVAWHADPFRTAASGFLSALGPEFAVVPREVSAHFDGQRLPIRLTEIRRR